MVPIEKNLKLFRNMLERGLKAKSIGISKVRAIVLDWISVDSILFDRVVAEIFFFKPRRGFPNYNFIDNPDVLAQCSLAHT